VRTNSDPKRAKKVTARAPAATLNRRRAKSRTSINGWALLSSHTTKPTKMAMARDPSARVVADSQPRTGPSMTESTRAARPTMDNPGADEVDPARDATGEVRNEQHFADDGERLEGDNDPKDTPPEEVGEQRTADDHITVISARLYW
jgi:hypothetical protein